MSQSHAFGPRPLRFQLSFGVVTLLMFSLFAVAPLLGILVYSYQENERSALANLERQVNRNMAETQQASVELIDSVARNMAIVAAVTVAVLTLVLVLVAAAYLLYVVLRPESF